MFQSGPYSSITVNFNFMLNLEVILKRHMLLFFHLPLSFIQRIRMTVRERKEERRRATHRRVQMSKASNEQKKGVKGKGQQSLLIVCDAET